MSRSPCVRRDTLPGARHTVTVATLVTLVLALALPPGARAEPRALAAAVVWTRADLVYVASADSLVWVPGMTIRIARGRREVASAVITRLLEPRLAVASLASGSLAREKRLDRLRVSGETPAPARVTSLRVALPGRGRANALFACASAGAAVRFAGLDYASEALAGGDVRLHLAAGVTGPAPDTLLVRFFAESPDEEIALERGDCDVAVFWPGELSARMRADARWREYERGLRSRGVLARITPAADTSAVPREVLDALNAEVFAGDMLRWDQLENVPAGETAEPRWSVDPALPGARALERVLARFPATPGRAARLAWLDVPVAARDAAQSPWRTPGVTPLFALRCPVLAAPALQPLVRSLGAGAFADLVTCGERRP